MNAPEQTPVRPRRLRNGVRGLLLIALVIVVWYGLWVGFQRWYAATHPLEIAWSRMHTTIRNGDTMEDLEQSLGPGQIMDREEVPEWLLRNAHGWPDGFQDGDQFVRWKFENNTLHFQFRNGMLINHNPAEYADPDQFFSGVQ